MSTNSKKIIKGIVVSDKMQKTRIVEVKRKIRHRLYAKIVTRTSRYMVHDVRDISKVGDMVEIVYAKPLSRRKSWEISNIL